MQKKEKEQKQNQDNFLLYIPSKKHDNWKLKDGKVMLFFEHTKPIEKLVRWLVKKPYVSDIALDEMGTAVWQSIDGTRTIYEIGQCIEEQFGEKCQPLYDRMVMYVRYLVKKGWVKLDRGNQQH